MRWWWRRMWQRGRPNDASMAIVEAEHQRVHAYRQTPRVNQTARYAQEQADRASEYIERVRRAMDTRRPA